MRNGTTVLVAVAVVAMGAQPASALTLTELWRASGFEGPESAVYDPASGALYVTNVAGDPATKDGRGFVSKVGLDGTVVAKEWVAGLDAPLGMDLADGKLYVADVDHVIVIDIASAAIEARISAAGAQFLNDVTVAPDGRVFVSDMMTDTIWLVADGTAEAWLQSDALNNPNGLRAEADRIVVGSWGRMKPDFSTEVPGHLLVVDYATKSVAPLGDTTPAGNLDGVEPDGQGGYIVTDWMAGAILHADAKGTTTLLVDLPQGAADHEVILDQNLVIVPMMLEGELVAFRIVR
jgi:sugar lactone lactonase YvrE